MAIANAVRADRTRAVCAIAVGCLLAAAQPARAATLIYGYAHANKHLVSFFSDAPGDLVGDVALSGLGSSEFLAGLDFRPATGELYSVARAGDMVRVVTIDTATGAVTQVGTPQPASFGSPYGLDFNSVTDRLHLVGDTHEIEEFDPDSGVGVLVLGLSYGSAESPSIAHLAYANSTAGATTTTLYGIDSVLDRLVVIDVSTGGLTTIGDLGQLMSGLGFGGFDIEPGTNAAYAALQRDISFSSLYSVDLATGQATEVGAIGGGRLIGIAIAPEPGAFASSLCALALLGWLRRRTPR